MPNASQRSHDQRAFLWACELDVLVRKPGNVSVASPGHRMTADLFIAAAHAAVEGVFARGEAVGVRIEHAVAAAQRAAGCNTSLGILLLCVPIAVARERVNSARTAATLRHAIEDVLAKLDVDDARATYRAIAHANPGGLGHVSRHDVHESPAIDLRSAMRTAADRDSIARQYANGFADLFDTGLPEFERGASTSIAEAVLSTFLAFAAGWPDSHVERKFGHATARALAEEAAQWRATHPVSPDAQTRALAEWDDDLKRRDVNPGTSADLTVATAFIAGCLDPALTETPLR